MYLVYGKDGCSACLQACHVLAMKGFDLKYKKLGKDYDVEELFAVTEGMGLPRPRTFPQIFVVNGSEMEYIGGFDNLKEYLAE